MKLVIDNSMPCSCPVSFNGSKLVKLLNKLHVARSQCSGIKSPKFDINVSNDRYVKCHILHRKHEDTKNSWCNFKLQNWLSANQVKTGANKLKPVKTGWNQIQNSCKTGQNQINTSSFPILDLLGCDGAASGYIERPAYTACPLQSF